MIRTLLLGAAFTGLAALLSPAQADTRTINGNTLVATISTDSDVSIEPEADLHGQIRVMADDLSCVHLGPGPLLNTSGCSDDMGHLRIEVPRNGTVTLNQSGDGAIHMGDLDGTLIADVNGSGDLTAGRVHTLVLNLHGSGDVTVESASGSAMITSDSSGDIHLHRLEGALRSVQNGSGDIAIGTIESPAVDMALQGSGDAVIGKGHIEALRVALTGSGDMAVAATADFADLHASGGGDIRVAHVNRDVHKSASGGSTISVYNSDIAEFGFGKLAKLASSADDDDSGSSSPLVIHTHHSGSGSGSGALHFFAGLAVLLIIYAIWRTIQRNGGMGPLQARFAKGPGMPPQPSHPGVIAVRDTMVRLEARLARVEGYVTTREFDLQRKFRELDKT